MQPREGPGRDTKNPGARPARRHTHRGDREGGPTAVDMQGESVRVPARRHTHRGDREGLSRLLKHATGDHREVQSGSSHVMVPKN